MTSAYGYLRVSSKGQVEGDGFDRQLVAIHAYAHAHGLTIAAEFRDEGVSGTKEAIDRPGLTALVEAVLAGDVRLIIVERSDRLARDLIVGELILRQLSRLGVKVVDSSGNDLSVSDNDPTKKLIRQVLSAVAEFEKAALVLKLRASRDRKKAKTGRCEGRKPFGHHPAEVATLSRMKSLRADGLPLVKIADTLNGEGLATRSGGKWFPGVVGRILGRGD